MRDAIQDVNLALGRISAREKREVGSDRNEDIFPDRHF
jgi:hypothetical protein